MAKNILIGVGNLLFCDDGIGVLVANYLEKNFTFSPEFEILDGGTLGFNLLEYFLEYDNVVIVDTISLEDEVGSIYAIPSKALLGTNRYKNTAHEVEVVQMIEASSLYDTQANITIIAMVPEDISTIQIGLSEVVLSKFDSLIDEVLQHIESLHVKVTQKDKRTLEDVIKELRRE